MTTNNARRALAAELLRAAHPELQTGSIVTDLQAEQIVARIDDLIRAHVDEAVSRLRDQMAGGR